MNEIEQKKKKSMLSTLIRYVFGVFLLLLSAVSFSSSFTAGFLFLIATLITIPSTAAQLERKYNYSTSGTIRFFVVFFLVIVASSLLPPVDSATTINNSTDSIAAPLTSVNDRSTIVMPASTETPDVIETETPDIAETSNVIETETPDIAETSNVIETETPDVAETSNVIETETSDIAETSNVIETETPDIAETSNTIETNSILLYASSESDVYHYAGCSYIKRIKPENLITFKSVEEAEAAGYRACKRCG